MLALVQETGFADETLLGECVAVPETINCCMITLHHGSPNGLLVEIRQPRHVSIPTKEGFVFQQLMQEPARSWMLPLCAELPPVRCFAKCVFPWMCFTKQKPVSLRPFILQQLQVQRVLPLSSRISVNPINTPRPPSILCNARAHVSYGSNQCAHVRFP